MLQQTQVARVMGHWPRFLRRYPTVGDLAEATVDAVRDAWQGLGYYARARNLHAAARHVVAVHDGIFPSDPATLRSLPGIGRYTAGAVASIAFGADEAAVDTNVARVLRRVFRVPGARGSSAHAKRLWKLAERLVPRGSRRRLEPGVDGPRRHHLRRAAPALRGVPGRAGVPVGDEFPLTTSQTQDRHET